MVFSKQTGCRREERTMNMDRTMWSVNMRPLSHSLEFNDHHGYRLPFRSLDVLLSHLQLKQVTFQQNCEVTVLNPNEIPTWQH